MRGTKGKDDNVCSREVGRIEAKAIQGIAVESRGTGSGGIGESRGRRLDVAEGELDKWGVETETNPLNVPEERGRRRGTRHQ